MHVSDECGIWTSLDEPSPAEFEAAEEEDARARTGGAVVGIARAGVALTLVVALLFYFVVPFHTVAGEAYRWLRSTTAPHSIPLAPRPPSNQRLHA